MKQKELFDDHGEILRDEGITRAINHAELDKPGWKANALEFVKLYQPMEYMTEDLRQFAYERGLPRPPHERAWGAVMVAAAKLGWIKSLGIKRKKSPEAHTTPAVMWKRLVNIQ